MKKLTRERFHELWEYWSIGPEETKAHRILEFDKETGTEQAHIISLTHAGDEEAAWKRYEEFYESNRSKNRVRFIEVQAVFNAE